MYFIKKQIVNSLLIIALIINSISPANAQVKNIDTINNGLLETVTIKENITTKQPIGKTLDVVALKREQMLRTQGNNLMNTLEKLPGISSIPTGTGIAKPVIRGMSLNRVIVTEYGIKQEGQQWGIDHGLEIDQFNVERIEAIKGPMSVLYGSDGIGGVLQILPPSIPSIKNFALEYLGNYKSNNNLWGSSVKLLYSTPKFYILARATYQDYASYKVPAAQFTYNNYQLPIYNNRLKNTGGKELNGSLLLGIKRNWGNSSIYFSQYNQEAGFFTGAFGIPRAYQLTDDGQYRVVGLPKQMIQHTKLSSNTTYIWKSNKIEIDLGLQYNKRQELSQPHAHGNGYVPTGNTALSLKLLTLSGNIRHQILGLNNWNITNGVQLQYQDNKISGFEFLIPAYQQNQIGLFNFTEYKASQSLLINAGLRIDYAKQNIQEKYVYQYNQLGQTIDSSLRANATERKYWNFTGSMGLAWQFAPRQKIKFNVGTAYRIPSIAELGSNGVHHGTFRHELGNNALNPERGIMSDLGWHIHKPKWNFVLTPFVSYFQNYLYLRPTGRFSTLPEAGQVYQYSEAPAVFAGFEWSVDWKWLKNVSNDIAIEYVWNNNLQSNTPIPFTPPFSILEEITWEPQWKKSWLLPTHITLSGHYFAAQNRVDRNEPTTGDYFLIHLSAAQTFTIAKQKITLYFQARNLTNTVYYNNMSRYRILNLPEQGRNMQVMLKWNFN